MVLRCTRLHESTEPVTPTHELHLGYDERVKSRLAAVCSDGTAVAILLPRGTILRDGAVLVADDGARIRVVAAAQPVVRITAPTPLTLMRAVYHLANRHVPASLAADCVLIEPDPVLERLLESLGARVEHVQMPFDPEAGAYGGHVDAATEHGDESATLGEQLSIEAHRERLAALAKQGSPK